MIQLWKQFALKTYAISDPTTIDLVWQTQIKDRVLRRFVIFSGRTHRYESKDLVQWSGGKKLNYF